jgi:hypothetical protein
MSGGVSITTGSGGNVDLDAIIKGGDAYMQRVKDFREAQQAAEDARSRLGIANNVLELRDQASRHLSEAQQQAEQIKDQALQDAARAQKSLQEWVMQTRDLTQKDRAEVVALKAEAETLNKNAKENHAASLAKLAEADDRLAKAKAAHEAVLAASAALNKAVG